MVPTYFCSRCGWERSGAGDGRAACGRCGHAFNMPGAGRAPTTTAYDIWTAVLLYVCMPVGLAMLWIHPTWPLRRKVLLTSLAICLIVVPIILCLLMVVAWPTIFHQANARP